MITKIAATLALTLGLATSGLAAAPALAEMHPHGHHHFGGPFFFGPRIVFEQPIYQVQPCRGLLFRAQSTGSRYWYHRWHECRLQVYGIY